MADFFSGNSEHTLDNKGRVIVPAKHRARFADGGFLARGNNRSLALLTRATYEKKAEEWLARYETGEEEAAEYWASGVEEVAIDPGTGRVLIPPYMRRYAQLELNAPVLLTGAITHIAIWNPSLFEERITAVAEPGFTRDVNQSTKK
jgi:MraZ protein